MHIPKTRNTYCQKCKKHIVHKVTQYKKGKGSGEKQGDRRYRSKQKGFGGQTKPVFKKKAKQTKKITLRLECTVPTCKRRRCKVLKRSRSIVLGEQKAKAGGPMG